MITYQLNIHCQESRYYASDMEFVMGDVGAYCLEFTFFDNGKKMDLSDCVLTVKARKSDGVVLSDAGEINNGVGRIVLKNGFYDVPGTVELEIALTDSAKNHVTTKIVSATVIAGAGEPEGTAENDVNVYVTLIAQLKAMMDKLPAYDNAVASGEYAHAEGQDTVASALTAHAEGRDTQAVEKYSHAEGRRTTASGIASHVEGINSVASGQGSHAEGLNSVASGQYSHAEGDNTQATGQYGAHSEGAYTQAGGETSHAEGYHTIASGNYQHVQGRFNVEDTRGIYAHIVGGGNDSASPKNIHTIDWSGNAMFSGEVSALGGILATEAYVGEQVKQINSDIEKLGWQTLADVTLDDKAGGVNEIYIALDPQKFINSTELYFYFAFPIKRNYNAGQISFYASLTDNNMLYYNSTIAVGGNEKALKSDSVVRSYAFMLKRQNILSSWFAPLTSKVESSALQGAKTMVSQVVDEGVFERVPVHLRISGSVTSGNEVTVEFPAGTKVLLLGRK